MARVLVLDYALVMFDAAKKDNARYASVAARLLADLSETARRVAKFECGGFLHANAAADNTAATVRPSR